MTLPLASSQVNKLQLRYDHILRIFDVLLADDETQDAVTSRRRIVYPVRCHHLVFEAFPEVLEAVLARVALKLINILNEDIVVRRHFYLETRNAL